MVDENTGGLAGGDAGAGLGLAGWSGVVDSLVGEVWFGEGWLTGAASDGFGPARAGVGVGLTGGAADRPGAVTAGPGGGAAGGVSDELASKAERRVGG